MLLFVKYILCLSFLADVRIFQAPERFTFPSRDLLGLHVYLFSFFPKQLSQSSDYISNFIFFCLCISISVLKKRFKCFFFWIMRYFCASLVLHMFVFFRFLNVSTFPSGIHLDCMFIFSVLVPEQLSQSSKYISNFLFSCLSISISVLKKLFQCLFFSIMRHLYVFCLFAPFSFVSVSPFPSGIHLDCTFIFSVFVPEQLSQSSEYISNFLFFVSACPFQC